MAGLGWEKGEEEEEVWGGRWGVGRRLWVGWVGGGGEIGRLRDCRICREERAAASWRGEREREREARGVERAENFMILRSRI